MCHNDCCRTLFGGGRDGRYSVIFGTYFVFGGSGIDVECEEWHSSPSAEPISNFNRKVHLCQCNAFDNRHMFVLLIVEKNKGNLQSSFFYSLPINNYFIIDHRIIISSNTTKRTSPRRHRCLLQALNMYVTKRHNINYLVEWLWHSSPHDMMNSTMKCTFD